MSVVSFDEDECLAFLEVPVTSVAMPLAELGGAAVDQLIARIERQPAGDVMIREPMKLLYRQSVARPTASRPVLRGQGSGGADDAGVLAHGLGAVRAGLAAEPAVHRHAEAG